MSDITWLPRIALDVCNGCGECIQQCATSALGWQNGKAALLYPERCIYSAACETVCPVGAIELPYLIVKSEGKQRE